MAHIPMDDVQTLWNEIQDKSWSGLHQVLEQHRGKTNGISDNLIQMMIPETEELEKRGEPFPDSPEKLSEVLNENLEKYA